jgi:XisH protein
MPAKDKYHDVVVRALKKDGWTVKAEQIPFRVGGRRVIIDIQAVSRIEDKIILVEVKGFENMPSPVDYLASAVGQYVLYRAILEVLGIQWSLFVVVPIAAYRDVLAQGMGKIAVEKLAIRLMIFDPSSEEVVKWMT